ncbi:MAG TPA: flagellar biosynthetic protein FliO [bacterium]|jgi:flagellar biosynthetic protein FliO
MRKSSRWFLGLMIFLPVWGTMIARAAGESPANAPDLGLSSLKAVVALFVVLALILGAAWAARRFLPFLPKNPQKGDQIQILSVRALGSRKSLHLVQVEGRRLLVGSTDTNINLIKDLEKPS